MKLDKKLGFKLNFFKKINFTQLNTLDLNRLNC